jgi:hypothetical protein
VREAFKDLLKAWGRAHDLAFVPEYGFETAAKERRRYVDAASLHEPRAPFGYREATDEKDNLPAVLGALRDMIDEQHAANASIRCTGARAVHQRGAIR